MNNALSKLIVASLLTVLAPFTQAALDDLGNGLVLDSELGIMWLKDANLASSNDFGVPGIDPSGTMNKATADAFIDALNEASYLGYSNWRLPRINPTNGLPYDLNESDDFPRFFDGTGDIVYNIGAPGTSNPRRSELGHLYYSSLDGIGVYLLDGESDGPDAPDTGPFDNMRLATYWSGSAVDGSNTMSVDFSCGAQCHTPNGNQNYVWPVRSTGPAAIPVTSPWTLVILAGLLTAAGILALRLRFRSTA